MRHYKILLALLVLSVALVALILTRPKSTRLHHMVDQIHSLIQPFPETYQMCQLADEVRQASRDAKYRLEVRIVTLPYCKGKCEVPPISGYLNNIEQFMMMEAVQGCLECSTLQWPTLEIAEGQTIHNIANYQINVIKKNDRFFLEYSWGNGFIYSYEFDLPEGKTFVCSHGQHGMQMQCDYAIPFVPSRYQPRSMYQTECLLLVRYQEIEPAAVK